MLASLTPQEAVNRFGAQPSECDIVVVVLWSRMGTRLDPAAFGEKPGGGPYLSGTEWEFEDAWGAKPRSAGRGTRARSGTGRCGSVRTSCGSTPSRPRSSAEAFRQALAATLLHGYAGNRVKSGWSFEFAWLRFANRRGLIEPSASVGGC